jgi:hypothetical protein
MFLNIFRQAEFALRSTFRISLTRSSRRNVRHDGELIARLMMLRFVAISPLQMPDLVASIHDTAKPIAPNATDGVSRMGLQDLAEKIMMRLSGIAS